jgi:hypothetical protein
MRSVVLLALAMTTACKSDFDLDPDVDNPDDPDDDTDTEIDDGPAPDIYVDPPAVSFGTKLPDCPTEPTIVTVSNLGDRDLVVSEVELLGDGTSAYTLFGTIDTIAPGGQADLSVVFEAGNTIPYEARIRIASNDPDEPNTRVDLEGEGGMNATNEDLFYQAEPNAVDVLWVLDNSCSMSDIQTQLEAEFDNFIGSFTSLGLDYQVAVVTTDMDNPAQSGQLQGMGVISPSTVAAAGTTIEAAFDEAVEPNSTGSGDEKALGAAYAALGSPGYAVTAGLIRDDANLAIIVVGDEDDYSSQNATGFTSWFEGLKGNDPNMTTVAGIVSVGGSLFDPTASCIGDSAKLGQVIDATGGIKTPICDVGPDTFDDVLRWLSYSAAGLRSEFPLTDTPANGAAGMTVRVNGTLVAMDPFRSNGWSYNRVGNSVVFWGATIPGPGAEVRIEYPVAGTCN